MRKIWTKEEKNKLIKLYSNTSNSELARLFNRTRSAIEGQAHILGLRKSEEYMNSENSGRILKGEQLSKRTQFSKGHKPFNKGLKGFMKANATSFAKGHLPHNHKPIGSERITKDGYIEIKVQEPNKWLLKHRLIWIESGKDIPKGMIVTFKDGNKLNTNLDNLVLISRVENMAKNTIQRFPQELIKTIKVIHKLKKQINNGTKQN